MGNMAILATEATGASGMTEAVQSLLEVATTVLTTITGNPTLMVFFCAGILFIGIGVVKSLK